MIINFKIKNIFFYDNVDIDFLIHSKKIGKYIKDDDFIKYQDLKIQKKIGIIGANSSGKTSFLNSFLLFSHFFNIGNLYRVFYEKNFFSLSSQKINQKFVENFNNIDNDDYWNQEKQNLKDYKVDENILQDLIKRSYESFVSKYSFDSNKEKIEFEIKFLYKKNVILGEYIINKNGIIEYSFKKNNKEIYKNTINFYNLNSFSNLKLTYENWELNLLWIPFDTKFDFGIIDSVNFPVSTNNRIILTQIFDYTRNNGKTNHFLKWIKIADCSIKDLISDAKNKIFNVLKENNETISIDNLSLGTKKWILLYYYLFVAIKKSDEITNLIIYDEIENSFHNKLVCTLFEVFDKKVENSQLVFVSHNPEIFEKTFKHDGIYIPKQNKNSNSLIRFDELKFRKDINFRSIYLNEKIGVHPNDQIILDFYDE